MGSVIRKILEKYSESSYEKKGKVRTLFLFMAGILPLVMTHYLAMLLILGNSMTSLFSLIMLGFILTIIFCIFLLSRGMYTLSTTILLLFVTALLGLNTYNTMATSGSTARFIASIFPLVLIIPFSAFFTNRMIFTLCVVLVLAVSLLNIYLGGEMLQQTEALVSTAVIVFTIVSTSALCLAVVSINASATKLRIRDHEVSRSKQLSINEGLLNSLIEVAGSLDGSSREMKSNSSNFSENMQSQAASMEEMTATVEEITSALENVNKNIDDQNASIESLITRMKKLCATARSIEDRISGTSDRINMISGKAKSGEENMEQMSRSILNISDTSNEMTGIINIINDISDRINLLSLNAAIEAARAGEAGRGFAVVADEVSKLAEQTTSSVKEISDMIQRSEEEISRGMANARNTVDTIGEIIAGINEINEMTGIIEKYLADHTRANDLVMEETERVKTRIGEVVISTREQKKATQEIVNSINNMNERTQANAAGAEKIFNDSESIAVMAGDLREKIKSFDLSEI